MEAVKEANSNPYNLRGGASKPYDLHYDGSECEAIIGGNRFTTVDSGYGTVMVPISVDGVPLLGFILGDGHLLLNLNLFDEFNNLVLRIRNNELVYHPEPWDIELIGRNLIVREAQRKILIDVNFEVPNRIVVKRGRFLCNGVEILVRPDRIFITNNACLLQRGSARNSPGGLIIGRHDTPLGGFMSIPSVSRYLGDRSEALKWAKEVLEQRDA